MDYKGLVLKRREFYASVCLWSFVMSLSQLNVRDLRSAFAGFAELHLSTEDESQMPETINLSEVNCMWINLIYCQQWENAFGLQLDVVEAGHPDSCCQLFLHTG
ncbi:hypothetical protein NC653_039190 [Populus alba x Populus x berolinensis]|uniref:Uncharacterized protein n=1 Tax=Populus alba x Populus x berolinensis TaxID=444605 RepID=A0AAD6LAL3_9ROSI|nr:hypothetical protein NC653_039190 [Populus alba x Populus x berolinensis]